MCGVYLPVGGSRGTPLAKLEGEKIMEKMEKKWTEPNVKVSALSKHFYVYMEKFLYSSGGSGPL